MTTQTSTGTPAATEPTGIGEAHVAFLSEQVIAHHERREIGRQAAALELDELVDEWRLMADTVAERATALGFFPDGQCGTLAQKTEFRPLPEGDLRPP